MYLIPFNFVKTSAQRSLHKLVPAVMADLQSSSPDPLGLCDENVSQASNRRAIRPSISPRKPLTNSSGNVRRQEFYISTPPAKVKKSFDSDSPSPKKEAESPWRIRLTVEAERVEDHIPFSIGGNMCQGMTTTTTVPLKGGDDELSGPKRGRGRPRKSLVDQRPQNGTPRPKAIRKRKDTLDADDESMLDSWAPTPPRRRTSRSTSVTPAITEHSQSEADLQNRTSTPTRRSPERLVKARPFSRSRSRNRRKEITPRKLGQSIGQEEEIPSMVEEVHIIPDQPEAPSPSPQPCLVKDIHESQADSLSAPPAAHLTSPCETSTQSIEDEQMWRNMIRKHSVSPAVNDSPSSGLESVDPTDYHRDFDTILESEEFSMVSVESLKSTAERLKEPSSMLPTPPSSDIHDSRRGSERLSETPLESKYGSKVIQDTITNTSNVPSSAQVRPFRTPSAGMSTPTEPAAPKPRLPSQPTGHGKQQLDDTSKYDRAVKAGEALQSVESPHSVGPYVVQKLASPFHENERNPSGIDYTSKAESKINQPPAAQPSGDTLFGGFSPATRRELKAGLRLGEELAKRQDEIVGTPMQASTLEQVHASPSVSQPHASPSVPESNVELKPISTQGSLLYPTIRTSHLPSPVDSVFSESNDQVSWHIEPSHETRDCSSLHEGKVSSSDPDSEVDPTMMAREAEWQREREAVSKQINEANASQVIVINGDSDSEDQDTTRSSPDVDPHFDLSLARDAVKMENGRVKELLPKTEETSNRRCTIPSPWRRRGEAAERSVDDSCDSDLFWEPDMADIEAARRREARRTQREASQGPSQHSTDFSATKRSAFAAGGSRIRKLQPTKRSLEETGNKEAVEHAKLDGVTTSLDSNSFAANQSRLQPAEELMVDAEDLDSTNRLMLDSFEANRSRIQPTQELIDETDVIQQAASDDESIFEYDSYAANREMLQPTEELLAAEDATVTLAEDVPPDVVPLPDSPSLLPVDPNLLAENHEKQVPSAQRTLSQSKHAASMSSCNTAPVQASSSWVSALTAPIMSLFSSGPSCPAATKEDILISSPHERMPMMLPVCETHIRALEPLVWASVLFNPDIFPFNTRSLSNYVLGSTVRTRGGWARTITKADCGVLDAFLVLFRWRGIVPPSGRGLNDGERLTCKHIAGMIVSIWVQMVMEGHASVKDWKGVTAGLTRRGDRMWRETDVVRLDRDVKFVHSKREDFQRNGLPSWKERGLQGPFKLAKPL